jgi:predicted regulator of Ras-like GTPase activity (Roadblock/LC7/MglB family)
MMSEQWYSVDTILVRLLRYREVLGAVAFSSDGLVVGSAGVAALDADRVGALGASLVGASERTLRRLGAGVANEMTFNTGLGMVHLRRVGDLAIMLFTDRCDSLAAGLVCEAALNEMRGLLTVG